MTPESEHTPPLHPKTPDHLEAPLDQESDNELVSAELTEDADVSALRRQGSELSASTQATIELHLARTFVQEAPTLLGALVQAVSPNVFQDQYGQQVQASKEFPFRQQLLEVRDAVFELVQRGSEIAKEASPLIKEGPTEKLETLVSNDLRALVADVSQLYKKIENLQLEIYQAMVELKIQNFPSQRAIEQQIGKKFDSFQDFESFRSDLVQNDPDTHVLTPLRFGQSLWDFVNFQHNEREQIDINTVVAGCVVVGSGIEMHLSEEAPLASVRPSDFHILLSGTLSWIESGIREASKVHMREIGKENRLFELITQDGFMESPEGRYLTKRFLEEQSLQIKVNESGEIRISVPVAAEILDSIRDNFAATTDTGAALHELANRNQIDYELTFADGEIAVTYRPIAVTARDEKRLESLKALFGEHQLGLPQVDEFGIPQGDQFEAEVDPEEEREEQSSSMVFLPRQIAVPDSPEPREYLLAVQGAAILSAEAGEKLCETAAQIDKFVALLPDMSVAVVQKLSVQIPNQGERPGMVVQDRFAMTLDQAYRKGVFDFITFSPRVESEPDPRVWSKRLGIALEQQFSWITTAEALPAEPELERIDEDVLESTAQDGSTPPSSVLFDALTFDDTTTLEALQGLSRFGHFRTFGVYQDALTELTQEKTVAPLSPADLLKETARVVATIGAPYPERSLSFSLGFAFVPQLAARGQMETMVKLEIQNEAKEVILKGHLVPETGKIMYREVVAANTVELITRAEKAIASLPNGTTDIHDIIHALEAEKVRISDPVTALSLLGHLTTANSRLKPAELLKRMLKVPGMYIDRDTSDQLILRKYQNEEMSSAS